MDIELLNDKIAKTLCGEFQSVWMIDIKSLKLKLYTVKEGDRLVLENAPVFEMQAYETGRRYYADNYVIGPDRSRFLKETELSNVLEKIRSGMPFTVEYNHIVDGMINYAQMFFSRIESDIDVDDFILAGIREIDIRDGSEIDDLTNLYTRQTFFRKAEKLIADNPNESFDLMISDIVDFKEINETYGPVVGDDILRWLGSFLSPFISEELIVGRYGGDQIVMLSKHDMIAYISSSEGIDNFKYARENNGLPYFDIKFGIYENVSHDKTILSICDRAHIALNSIKHQYDKVLAYYDDKLKKEREIVRKIEGSMHQAIEQEQFKVYYQPKHDAQTGKLVGAEALIRWIHPEYGFMSPGDFIPLFEKNGFVVESDAYVWKRTCDNLKRWKEEGINIVPISVNASKLTFKQVDLLTKLHTVVVENNISPEMLHIEITETLMTDDIDALVRKLNAIRSIGHKIELDDFGAGYSSINVLSTLPLDIVKLDMSFMKQFGDEKRTKVLAACINLAKQLGYKTVSEGVELKEQYDLLGILGVDYIQGYYFSKPLPEKEFEEYMKKYS